MSRAAETYLEPQIFELGKGTVAVVRHRGGGRVEVGIFLVDMYCLGAKDAMYWTGNEAELSEKLWSRVFLNGEPRKESGAYGRKLVEDAVAYARSLGFSPGPDYKKGARVFGGIEPKECTEEFTFGKDGKPFYISGPDADQASIDRILGHLRKRCGEGGFHFLVAADQFADQGE